MSFMDEALSRYLSSSQLKDLASVHVGIAGAGGLGSNLAMLLVRSGFKKFTLVDYDRVEKSNLNRQFFFPEDCGKYKVHALAENLKKIEENLNLNLIVRELSHDNAQDIFKSCDAVLEAFDSAKAKAMLYKLLGKGDIFYVSASGLSGWGNKEMSFKKLGKNSYLVGDFETELSSKSPPMAPRVMQAAAMQANLLLSHVLGAG